MFAKGFVTDYPLTIRHRDGKLVDVLYNASVYRDVGGNVLGVFAAARDVTAQKQADEALRKVHADLERRVEERTEGLVKIVREVRQGIEILSTSTTAIVSAISQVASGSS